MLRTDVSGGYRRVWRKKRSMIADLTLFAPRHEFNSFNGRLRLHEAYHNGMAAHICDFSRAALSP